MDELISAGLNQGLGYGLFIFLLLYVLKTTGEREKQSAEREKQYQNTIQKNQEIIKDLAAKFTVIETVKKDVEDIKEEIKTIRR